MLFPRAIRYAARRRATYAVQIAEPLLSGLAMARSHRARAATGLSLPIRKETNDHALRMATQGRGQQTRAWSEKEICRTQPADFEFVPAFSLWKKQRLGIRMRRCVLIRSTVINADCAAPLPQPLVPSPATIAASFCVRASTGRNAAPV